MEQKNPGLEQRPECFVEIYGKLNIEKKPDKGEVMRDGHDFIIQTVSHTQKRHRLDSRHRRQRRGYNVESRLSGSVAA